jgi:solute carrier family 13 (sodium-dependent dicarboxylate transporter), member 2/3/5
VSQSDAAPAGLTPSLSATVGRLARLGRWGGPVLFACFALAPWLGLDLGLADPARLTAGVAAWTALWWLTEAVPIGATSLLPAVLLPICGVLGARQVAVLYMNDLVLLFLGAFFLALLLERWNLHRRLALAIAVRVGPHPRRLVLGFMLAATFLSMWLNNTACALLLLPIADAVIGAVDPGSASNRRTPFAAAMLLGLAYSCSVGGMLTPVGTAPNQVLLGVLSEQLPERPELGFGLWIIATLPIGLIYIPCCWLLLTRLALKVDNRGSAGGEVLRAERQKLGPLSTPELRAGAIFLAAVFLWVFRSDLELGAWTLPGWAGLLPGLEISNATVALALAVLAFTLPAGAKTPGALLDWETARRIPLEVLLLLGGGFALAEAISVSELELVLASGLSPLMSDLPRWLAILVLVTAVCLLSEIASNTATVQIILPVLLSAALVAGEDPILWMFPATLAASCGFVMPVGTPPNAIVFTTGRLAIPTMARVGLWVDLGMIVSVTAISELWILPLLVRG